MNILSGVTRGFTIIIVLAAIAVGLLSCQSKILKTDTTETTLSTTKAVAVPTLSSQALPCSSGSSWCASYDTAIKTAVTDKMLGEKSISTFCPKYNNFTTDQKRQFFADLFFGVAKYESNYKPLSLYWESSLGKDSATKLPVVSEGMLQLSYQDEVWAHCGFDAKLDAKAIADDYAKKPFGKHTWFSVHPEKTILDPIRNLTCGIRIMDWRISHYPGRNFQENMGKYWATIRDQSSAIKAAMKGRNNACGF